MLSMNGGFPFSGYSLAPVDIVVDFLNHWGYG